MTQYGYEPLSPDDSGSTLLARMNGVVPALLTNHKGATRPDYVQPGMMWIDDSGAVWLLNLYDGASDVPIAAINPETHTFVASFVPLTRKIKGGAGVLINGGAEADLSGDINIAASGVPTGAVMGFDLAAPPVGWIVGDGSAINRHTYADLDAVKYCGDALNATATAWYRCTDPANPATTRSVSGDYLATRDLRGVFPRFLDGGRGYDSGRLLGSEQADQNLSHNHGVTDPGHGHGVSDPGHSHSFYGTGTLNSGPVVSSGTKSTVNLSTGSSTTGISIQGSATGISIQNNGGGEARPKNIALLGCIKY